MFCSCYTAQVSRSVCEGLAITVSDVVLASVLGAAVHAVFLGFNEGAARVLKLGGPDMLESTRLRQAMVLLVGRGNTHARMSAQTCMWYVSLRAAGRQVLHVHSSLI